MKKIRILPSLLAADVGNLEKGARLAEESGADGLHIDIMDGHFVPNLSMGPSVVKMAKKCINIPLSVHLMLTRPDKYIKQFIEAGSDQLMIHIESECDVLDTLKKIRELGSSPGITLNPKTDASAIFPVLEMVDEVLCMSVNPGYGGQLFMPEVLPKISKIKEKIRETGHDISILVDGGINNETALLCAKAGADTFIAGTSLYSLQNMSEGIRKMREIAASGYAF